MSPTLTSPTRKQDDDPSHLIENHCRRYPYPYPTKPGSTVDTRFIGQESHEYLHTTDVTTLVVSVTVTEHETGLTVTGRHHGRILLLQSP